MKQPKHQINAFRLLGLARWNNRRLKAKNLYLERKVRELRAENRIIKDRLLREIVDNGKD